MFNEAAVNRLVSRASQEGRIAMTVIYYTPKCSTAEQIEAMRRLLGKHSGRRNMTAYETQLWGQWFRENKDEIIKMYPPSQRTT